MTGALTMLALSLVACAPGFIGPGEKIEDELTFEYSASDVEAVEVSTFNGAVDVRGARNGVSAISRNGAIAIEDAEGQVNANTSNGAVRASLHGVDDGATFETSNGAVDVDVAGDVRGPVRVETKNGALTCRVARLHADADLRSSNGAITLAVAETLSGSVRAHMSRGSVRLTVPRDAALDLSARTSLGRIETDWGDARGALHQAVGRGGPAVVLETSLGSVSVRRGD
jgi:DUF4097 and DUF4098 domain-containing protein YvlB